MLYNNLNWECQKFASKSELKPEIATVLFSKNKTVATDAFRLLEVTTDSSVNVKDFPRLPDGKTAMMGFKPFMVPARAVAELAKMRTGKNSNLPILSYVAVSSVKKDSVEFIATDLEIGDTKVIRTIEGKFPDYEKLFNEAGNPVAEIKINGKLMAELLETMAKFNRIGEVTIKFYGKNKALLFEAGNNNQKARAALMPLREI